METWLRYLIAFVVFAHGFVYVRIGSVLRPCLFTPMTTVLRIRRED
jgi:hypothetical protein